jgi:hypothetical protein
VIRLFGGECGEWEDEVFEDVAEEDGLW